MLRNISQLQHIVSGKIYNFTCEPDSPLGDVKECLVKFLQYVGQIEDQVAAQQKKEADEKAASEAIVEEIEVQKEA